MWTGYSKQAHRFACLSLYKVLLSHCFNLPVSSELRQQAITAVRRRFRSSKYLQGRNNIHTAIKTAYSDESLLRRACRNDAPTVSTIIERLEQYNAEIRHRQLIATQTVARKKVKATAQSLPPPPQPSDARPKAKKKEKEARMPPEVKARRSLQLRRRPPLLIETHGFPVLRFRGRPQPRWISRLLERKGKIRQRLIDDIQYMEEEGMELAYGEDEWDRQIASVAPWMQEDDDDRSSTWKEQHTLQLRRVLGKMDALNTKASMDTAKMVRVARAYRQEREAGIKSYLTDRRRRARQRRVARERVGILQLTTKMTIREKRRRYRQRRAARESMAQYIKDTVG